MKIGKTPFLRFGFIIVFLVMLLNLSGCASKPRPPFEIKSPENGMIYGNVFIRGHEVTEIELREFGKLYIPPFVSPPRVMVFRNGNFVAENLRPANYYISRLMSYKLEYNVVKDARTSYQYVFKLEPGEVKYVGSFELTDIEPGIFQEGKFNVRSVRHPSERKVLKHMYDVTEGTGWQARIQRKIKSLR